MNSQYQQKLEKENLELRSHLSQLQIKIEACHNVHKKIKDVCYDIETNKTDLEKSDKIGETDKAVLNARREILSIDINYILDLLEEVDNPSYP